MVEHIYTMRIKKQEKLVKLHADLGDKRSTFSIFCFKVDELPNRIEMCVLPLLMVRCRFAKSTES